MKKSGKGIKNLWFVIKVQFFSNIQNLGQDKRQAGPGDGNTVTTANTYKVLTTMC